MEATLDLGIDFDNLFLDEKIESEREENSEKSAQVKKTISRHKMRRVFLMTWSR